MNTEARVELTAQVADLFRSCYRRGPLPSESDCYRLANAITIIRNNKSYKQTFEQENKRRSDRRKVIQAMKRLIKDKKGRLRIQLQALNLPKLAEEEKNLELLELALDRAEPALLHPLDPLAGTRNKAWWHKAARMLAQHAHAALKQAGRKRISFQKHGPLVEVVVGALKLATGEDFEPAAVASVLGKLPIKSGRSYLVRFSL